MGVVGGLRPALCEWGASRDLLHLFLGKGFID